METNFTVNYESVYHVVYISCVQVKAELIAAAYNSFNLESCVASIFRNSVDNVFVLYSVDEIALYDVPAMLSVIQQETKQTGNIIYIGHSLGTTMGMIYASERPEEAKSAIKLFIWISPSHKLTNMLSPYRMLAPFSPVILVSLCEGNNHFEISA